MDLYKKKVVGECRLDFQAGRGTHEIVSVASWPAPHPDGSLRVARCEFREQPKFTVQTRELLRAEIPGGASFDQLPPPPEDVSGETRGVLSVVRDRLQNVTGERREEIIQLRVYAGDNRVASLTPFFIENRRSKLYPFRPDIRDGFVVSQGNQQ
jgi:hypothetical protein